MSFQEEQQEAFNKGLLPVDRYDDVLGKSLPNPEHAGRVRGLGALVGIKKAYQGSGKRRRHVLSGSGADIEQRIEREVAVRVEVAEARIKADMAEKMKVMLAEQMATLMGRGILAESPTAAYSPTAVQSSCQSVGPRTSLFFPMEVMQINTYFSIQIKKIILLRTCLSFIHIIPSNEFL